MSDDAFAASKDSTKAFFVSFQEAFARLDFDTAGAAFVRALECDPGGAFRYFVVNASGSLATALNARSGRKADVIGKLAALTNEHPYLHYLADPDNPAHLQHVVRLRHANLDKGLPSIVFVPQGKSASVSVAAIFGSGFRLPSVCYSLVNLDIIDSWAADYARGGACYATHLIPSLDKVRQLKRAGISKIVVHVRDPRQALVSIVHHLDRYTDQMPGLRAQAALGQTVSERAQRAIASYEDSIRWISGWVELESEIDILFSTFEDFIADRAAFVERYLDFYGVHRAHFNWGNAFGEHKGVDNHFRSGRTDEWREVLEPAFAARISAMLPPQLIEKFGWFDPGDPRQLQRRRQQAVAWPSPRDRFLAWLYDGDAEADRAGWNEVLRLRQAGNTPPPPELEVKAVRARLRELPDHGVLLMRLCQLMEARGDLLPDGLAIHALRSRLAELSESVEGADRERVATQRAAMLKQLAVHEGKAGPKAHARQPVIDAVPTSVAIPAVDVV